MTLSTQLLFFATLLMIICHIANCHTADNDGDKKSGSLMFPSDKNNMNSRMEEKNTNLRPGYFPTTPQNISNDSFVFVNGTEDAYMQLVGIMPENQFTDEITKFAVDENDRRNDKADHSARAKKSRNRGDRKMRGREKVKSHRNRLADIREGSNATFRVNKVLTTENVTVEKGKGHPPLQICGTLVDNMLSAENLFQNISSKNKNKIRKLVLQYKEYRITKEELRKTFESTVGKITCINSVSTVSPTSANPESFLNILRKLIKEGYVEERMIHEVEENKITPSEVKIMLMKNPDFVLSRFPTKLSEMLKEERIPSHINEIMFSGNYTIEKLTRIIYQNDYLAKALLPERIREILENRDPPDELKYMLCEGYNDSTIVQMSLRNETLARKMMSESMFYFYTLFKVPRNVALNMALSATTIIALFCVMTSLGCTMTVTKIMHHIRRPKGVIIALISQYGIMPAAAFGLTRAFNLGVYPAIAVLICGCCPGGNLSNILAFAINGDMNLSILMTTCSSVLGLAMMPFLLFCYSRFIIPVDGAEIVPFEKIVLNIALTILPVTIGIAIKYYRPTWTKNVMRFGAVMLLICTITFSVIAGFLLGDKFFSYFPLPAVACAAILPITGYILGFVFARLVREKENCSRTISVETGCQNVQLCGTVLKLAIDPILIGAVMMLPIIYMAFQAGEALILITLYRLYKRFTKKKKSEENDNSEVKLNDEEKKFQGSDSERKLSGEREAVLTKVNDDEKNGLCSVGAKSKSNDEESTCFDEKSQLVFEIDNNFLAALEISKENDV